MLFRRFQENVLDIVITDTRDPDVDFFVNDALVYGKFAKFENEVNTTTSQPREPTPPPRKKYLKPKDLQRIFLNK